MAKQYQYENYMNDIYTTTGGRTGIYKRSQASGNFTVKSTEIGYSYMGFDESLHFFDVSRLPDYNNATEPYLGYIIMTRPDLNFSNANIEALKNNAQTAAFMRDKRSFQLFSLLSNRNSNIFLPIITTRAKTYSVSDIEINSTEKGGTYFGHTIKYGKHSEAHKIGGTMTIDFRNDAYLSILKMMYFWMCYIYQISKNDSLKIEKKYEENAELDYCGSIYYLVTRRDSSELVYWEKLVGVFPVKAPFSIFNFNDTMILEDTISIDFNYGIKADPYDPSILMDINVANGYTPNSAIAMFDPDSSYKSNRVQVTEVDRHHKNGMMTSPFVTKSNYATKPYITMDSSDSGRGVIYRLNWRSY